MTANPRTSISPYLLFCANFILFSLPMALFLWRFWRDVPFFFMAEDAFYYLSIALHSTHVSFFSIDGAHPTNGFHPLWEWMVYGLSRLPWFRLDGDDVLARFFAVDLALVATAVSLLSVYTYKLTRRPWLSMITFCPGLLWLCVGVGSPAYLNFWASVNGMETGVELLSLSVVLTLFSTDFRTRTRYGFGVIALGFVVLSRLDDIFFLIGILSMLLLRTPKPERLKRLLPFAIPIGMICLYLLYNHHFLNVWLPVSGSAKTGKGYSANLRETLRLVGGWSFFSLPAYATAFSYGNSFVMIIQMFAPMAVAGGWLLWMRRSRRNSSAVLCALAIGVLLKGAYNFVRVPISYQGLGTTERLLPLQTSSWPHFFHICLKAGIRAMWNAESAVPDCTRPYPRHWGM